MVTQQPARASPELCKAPLSPRYRRNYATTRGTTDAQWSPGVIYSDVNLTAATAA